MNNTFSMHRFILLLRKDWAENKKMYLFALPVMVAVIAFLFIMSDNIHNYIKDYLRPDYNAYNYSYKWEHEHEKSFTIGLVFLGACIAGLRYNGLSNKARSIEFLMEPSKVGEKLLLGWLFTFPVFLMVYTLLFKAVDYVFIKAYIEMAKTAKASLLIPHLTLFDLSHMLNKNIDEIGVYFMVSSVFFMGPLWFKRYAFVKTIVLVAVSILLFNVLSERIFSLFFTGVDVAGAGLDSVIIYPKKDSPGSSSYFLGVGHLWTIIVYVIAFVVFPLFIWLATWFKIKEKEV